MRAMTILGFIFISITAYSFPDSIGIKEEDGKKFIMHRVEKSEGLYAVSRRYKVSIDALMEVNPQSENGLVLGEIILVPVMEHNKIKGAEYHTVKSGETLYSISKKYEVKLEQLREWNNIQENIISLGQPLIVGISNNSAKKEVENQKLNNPVQPVKENPNIKTTTPDLPLVKTGKNDSNNTVTVEKPKEEPDPFKEKYLEKQEEMRMEGIEGAKAMNEEGVGTWINDTYMSTQKSLALHKSARPGTIIKVTNLMNKKVVYVKVVGFLGNQEDDNTIITISRTAAEKLDVKDEFFRVKLDYISKERTTLPNDF